MRVDQLVPAFHQGDAIGDTAFHLRNFLRSKGYESHIYCLTRDYELEGESRLFESFGTPASSDVTVLHFALPSPLTSAFMQLSNTRVIIYHNITPEQYFTDYSLEMARISRLGRSELQSLVPHVDLALADSEYNRLELEEMGYSRSEVFPLFLDFSKYEKTKSQFMYDLFNDDRVNILFVGRIVPNKKIEDLIKVVFYYKKYISPLVRLIVVGKTSSLPKYYDALIHLADEFYLKPEEICFTGHISDAELFALYEAADVFLSLSEHEGFGLPFIESMIFDLPIIAYKCTAVPYTLGEAGILIQSKPIEYVGELIYAVTQDSDFKKNLIQSQRQQLQKYKNQKLDKFLLKNLSTLAEGTD